MAIDWLKERLGIAGEYAAIKDLKKRVIDVAVEQINKHSDIRVSYAQRKTGRAVTHLIFDIGSKPSKKAEKPVRKKQPVIDAGYIAKHARPGESHDQAFRRLLEEAGQERLVA